MRIAIVGNFGLGYKGTMAARALPIARQLAQRGHAVGLFVPSDGGAATGDVGGPSVHSVGMTGPGTRPAGATSPFRVLCIGIQLVWQAWRFQPDVIYAFKPMAYAGLALLTFWLTRKLGLTRAALLLDTDDWEGIGGWADHGSSPWWQRRLAIWQEAWCLRHADVVTVASHELAWLVSNSNQAIFYAPNAASATSPGWRLGDGQAIRAALGIGSDPVVLAYTRFVEFSPARLLATFRAIVEVEPAAHLIVAGIGLQGEEQAFARFAAAQRLSDRVHLLGWVAPDALADVFAASDAALYLLDDTRLNRAKCPMKLVDLLLAGVAVVADDVGQAHEYVEDETNGRLVPAGDWAAMARATVDLLRDPACRSALGTAARARILKDWTWAVQVEEIERALVAARLHRI